MKRTILLLGLTVAWQAGHGQVQITSLDRTGLLQWTNPIQGSATYRVEWQSAATNRWQALATGTNRLWLLTTNSAMGTNHARLYRVAWAEGSPFALECRNAGGSLFTRAGSTSTSKLRRRSGVGRRLGPRRCRLCWAVTAVGCSGTLTGPDFGCRCIQG